MKKNLNVIDATCPDVIKTHDLIKTILIKGLKFFILVKMDIPESEGALSINYEHIHLIETKTDLDKLDKNLKYVITNQTTMSLYDVYDLCEYAKTQIPNLIIAKETCRGNYDQARSHC